MSATTQAGDWWQARQRGERLPEHILTPSLTADQFSGDLLCPLCGEPLEIRIAPSEDGAVTEGACAACMTIVEIF